MSSSLQKRVAAHQDSELAKKSRGLAIPDGVVVKQEQLELGEEAGQGGQGEGALAAVVQAMEMEEPHINNIRMAVSLLHCRGCDQRLKPPTFQCEAGHVLCGDCRGSHSHTCAGAGAYVHCAALDQMVQGAKVPCVYETYGCTSWVAYYEVPDHRLSCRFAPCFCPACGHFTSPARLAEHFGSDHAWPVSKVDYARPYKFTVPGPHEKLVLVGAADGCVFLLSPCALGAATAVSELVSVRACGDAAVGAPQYSCKLWTEVPGKAAMVTSDVASSDMAGGFLAIDQSICLTAPAPLPLMIRIDKVGVSRSPSATPPSSLPRRTL